MLFSEDINLARGSAENIVRKIVIIVVMKHVHSQCIACLLGYLLVL